MRRNDSNKMTATREKPEARTSDPVVMHDGNVEHMPDDIEALCLIHSVM